METIKKIVESALVTIGYKVKRDDLSCQQIHEGVWRVVLSVEVERGF